MRFSMVYMGDVESMRRGEIQSLETAKLPPGPEVSALLGSGVDVYIVIPMVAKGELIGGLSFGGAPGTFSDEQIAMAREVATQLAIAITQVRLHEAVKRTMTVLGAPDASIETTSFGEEKPVATGHDEQSWAQNRRADIKYAGE